MAANMRPKIRIASRRRSTTSEASDAGNGTSGAERESFHDVGPPHEATVHDHVRAAAHGLHDLREHVDGRGSVVQLPAAVI